MQRRAAAIYFVFFLVIGAGAYAYIGVVQPQKPQVTLDAPIKGGSNSSFSVGGQQYTIASVKTKKSSGGGGHGGGGGGSTIVGKLTWTNESARSTATLKNGTNVTYRNRTWQVLIANGSDITEFTLRERVNATLALRNDPAVANETASYRGEQWVVWAENETLKEPLAEYLPAPENESFSVGATFPYEGNDATVTAVTPEAATLAWAAQANKSAELTEGGNVTLDGRTYFVHFPNNETVKLAPVYASSGGNERSAVYANYLNTLDRQDYFTERRNGLWGISIISTMAAIILLGAAYLPVKD